MSDIVIPLTEGEDPDPNRHVDKDVNGPSVEIDAWRAKFLEPAPSGYLEPPPDV